jgi:hypothetical protein
VRVNCGVVGFDHKLTMCFGNITKSSELENKFIEFLKAQGVPVKTLNSFETNG